MRRLFAPLTVLLASTLFPSFASITDRQAAFADAYVDRGTNTGEWTIGNDGIRYTVAVLSDRTFRLVGLRTASSSDLVTLGTEPDTVVTIDDEVMRLGDRASGFTVERVDADEGTHFVSLGVRLVSRRRRPDSASINRSESPSFSAWSAEKHYTGT